MKTPATVRCLLAACVLVPLAGAAASVDGSHDFDFEHGHWHVHHRVLAKDGSWKEFEGTSNDYPAQDGTINIEENTFFRPGGTTQGTAVRTYDRETGQWAIWWFDSRTPLATKDPPNIGRFENGVGRFYCDIVDHGKTTRTRYTWTHRDADHAHWEQATSEDAGKTWNTNWVMEFERDAK